jgi:putative ABC transport system permease protein
VRIAWRGISRAPGLTVAAVLSLALGIGATLTAFGLLRAIEFPALPYPHARELVQIDAANDARQARGFPLSLSDYDDLARRSRAFQTLGVSTDGTMTLEDGAEPARIGMKLASPSYFTALGTSAELGRAFASTDSAAGVTNLVVLSHHLWAERYGSDAKVLGRTIRLDGSAFAVIGVMPARFDENVDAWVPLTSKGLASRTDRVYSVIGRVRRGVSLEQASAEVSTIARALELEHPTSNQGWTMSPTPLSRLRSRESGGGYYQLQGAVIVLLLAACANIANLLLARSVNRSRELAVRSALGASRGDIARLILLEGILLAFGGGAVGLLLSVWGTTGASVIGQFPASIHVPFDALTILAALGISFVAGLLVSVAPAIGVSRAGPGRLLREASARTTASRRQMTLRGLLVAAEVGCALVLVLGATLIARSLWNRMQREVGFDPRHATKAQLAIQGDARAIVGRIVESLGARPGVSAVGVLSYPISAGLGTPIPLRLPDGGSDVLGADVPRAVQSVSAGYFAAMGARMQTGRAIATEDRPGSAPVVVVNEELARRAWPSGTPIGRQLSLGVPIPDSAGRPAGRIEWRTLTVVGVVRNVRRSAMHDRVLPALYLSYDQFPGQNVTLVARSGGEPAALVPEIKRAVFAVDPRLVADDVQTLATDFSAFLRPIRLYATLLVTFGALALMLAAIGVFASMAYATAQRSRELGIRLALGADAAALVRLILRQGLRLATVGITGGLVVALAATRVLRGLLYGVPATDPMTMAAASLLLVVVVLLACLIPARRTAKLDPAVVLRAE